EEAGLQSGDHLLALNDVSATDHEQTVDYIQSHKGQPITLHYERGGRRQQAVVQTRRLSDGREGLGVVLTIASTERAPATLINAASFAVTFNIDFIRLTAKAIGQIFKGQRSARDTLAGPIGIARAASTVANEGGWAGVFGFLGFLSLNLGVMNLLPIPVLDGGAIFILLVEAILAVIGLQLTMGMRERIQQVGFVALLLLMGFVITNDLVKEVSRWRSAPRETAPAVEQRK
ncbi:MAG: site-2 protease family protein, partial [Pyrinomonadaceae bacterium]